MSNYKNNSIVSQDCLDEPNQKKYWENLHRCTPRELDILEYIAKLGRGMEAKEAKQVLKVVESTAFTILRRLSEPEFSKERFSVRLLRREKGGANGSFLYFLNSISLEDIKEVKNEKRYNPKYQLDEQNPDKKEEDFCKYHEKPSSDALNALFDSSTDTTEPKTENNSKDTDLILIKKLISDLIDEKLSKHKARIATLEDIEKKVNSSDTLDLQSLLVEILQ